jgi:hypothetical protein
LKYTGYYKCMAHLYMLGQHTHTHTHTRNSRLLLQCTWDLCPSVLIISVGWFITDISGQQVYPYSIVKKAKKNLRHLHIWISQAYDYSLASYLSDIKYVSRMEGASQKKFFQSCCKQHTKSRKFEACKSKVSFYPIYFCTILL